LCKRKAGIEITHVPYRGAGPAFNDLIPGRIDAMINFTASSLPLVRQGQLRALAVASAKRLSVAPDLPTMTEAGVAGVEVSSWSAFFVPARTPGDIIRKIHADTVAALAEPAVRGKLEAGGVVVGGSTPGELPLFSAPRWINGDRSSSRRASRRSKAAGLPTSERAAMSAQGRLLINVQIGGPIQGQAGKLHDEGRRTSYCRPAITLTTGCNSCA